jgi:hypothetical protein
LNKLNKYNYFNKNKDSDTVKLLEGMLKKSAYKDIIESHKGVQKSVIKNKGMGELKRNMSLVICCTHSLI